MLLAHAGHPHVPVPTVTWAVVAIVGCLLVAAGLLWWAFRLGGEDAPEEPEEPAR